MVPRVNELVYDCRRERLGASLAARFQPLARDPETEDWIARWQARPHGFWATELVDVLGRFVSSYDAHGLLGAYPMHLLSERSWGQLLGCRVRSLLDVGAGAGYVTERLGLGATRSSVRRPRVRCAGASRRAAFRRTKPT